MFRRNYVSSHMAKGRRGYGNALSTEEKFLGSADYLALGKEMRDVYKEGKVNSGGDRRREPEERGGCLEVQI